MYYAGMDYHKRYSVVSIQDAQAERDGVRYFFQVGGRSPPCRRRLGWGPSFGSGFLGFLRALWRPVRHVSFAASCL